MDYSLISSIYNLKYKYKYLALFKEYILLKQHS